MGVRRITNGGRKVVGKFPSLKMKRMIMWESQIERDYLYLVDFDSDVVSCQEQPLVVRYYDERDGKMHRYTPDFLLIRRNNKKQIIEVKDEKAARSDEYQQVFKRVSPILHREGYEFILVTDRMVRVQPLLRNAKLLHKYAATKISNEHLIHLTDIFASRAVFSLGELVTLLGSRGVSKQEIFALLRHGILSLDLGKEINSDSIVTFAINYRISREEAA